jgi:hypothetical protein
MKEIIMAMVCFTIFTSCDSKKNSTTNSTEGTIESSASTSKVTCMINGKPWAAKEFNCGISKKVGIVGLTFYCTNGKNSEQLLLAMLDYKKDYRVGGGIVYKKAELIGLNMNLAGFTITDEKRQVLKNYSITEGEVKLTTAKEDRAIGNFSFTAIDKEHGGESITVTDGKFDVEMNVE